MTQSVLVLCTGNICRSPVGASALAGLLPKLDVQSAGLHAVVGAAVDPESAKAADIYGIPAMPLHRARQVTLAMAQAAELILVMEDLHRREVGSRWPHLLGKTLLFGQFAAQKQIADPYRRGQMHHIRMAEQVLESAQLWAKQLG